MKNNLIWKIILIIGLFPFVIPFLLAYTRMSGWTLIDWLVMWSFVYWPTYVLGLVLIGFSIYKIKRLSITEHIIPFLSIIGATLLKEMSCIILASSPIESLIEIVASSSIFCEALNGLNKSVFTSSL